MRTRNQKPKKIDGFESSERTGSLEEFAESLLNVTADLAFVQKGTVVK